MRANFRIFKSTMKYWDTLLEEASQFASELGPQLLINIAHSCDHSEAVVVVWYWDKQPFNIS